MEKIDNDTGNSYGGFYKTSREGWEAMLDACEQATESIRYEQYIVKPNEAGQRFFDVFMRKAAEGVKVQLHMDAFGSVFAAFAGSAAKLRRAGVEVKYFNPFWKLHPYPLFFPRTHRKLMVVDNRKGFIGGVCVDSTMAEWRDTLMEFEGEAARQVSETFDRLWHFKEKRLHRLAVQPPLNGSNFNLYVNSPGSEPNYLRMLYRKVDEAKDHIRLVTPYFLPSKSFENKLELAMKRGVKVTLMVGYRANRICRYTGLAACGRLLRCGAQVYLYMPRFQHTKLAIIDDELASIGSLNLDRLSFYRNLEANMVLTDDCGVQKLKQQFNDDIKDCEHFTLEKWERFRWVYRAIYGFSSPVHALL